MWSCSNGLLRLPLREPAMTGLASCAQVGACVDVTTFLQRLGAPDTGQVSVLCLGIGLNAEAISPWPPPQILESDALTAFRAPKPAGHRPPPAERQRTALVADLPPPAGRLQRLRAARAALHLCLSAYVDCGPLERSLLALAPCVPRTCGMVCVRACARAHSCVRVHACVRACALHARILLIEPRGRPVLCSVVARARGGL